MFCVSPLDRPSRWEVSGQSTMSSIKLSFHGSYRHATLPLLALGHFKKYTCSTGACSHTSFDMLPPDFCTFISHRTHFKKMYYVSWYPHLSVR